MTFPFYNPVTVQDPTDDSNPATKIYVDNGLGGKSDTGHTHDLAYSQLGHTHTATNITSGTLDIARIPTGTSGTTVPLGNDSRFTDARTPTTHASSHATGGSDAVSPASIGAAATSHAHAADDITSGTFAIGRIPTGTTSSTVAIGNDARLSDARTPTAHVHSGADITSGTVPIAAIPTGTTGSTVPFGNDARFSDARTPTAHVHSGADITSGTVPVAQLPTGTSGTTVALGNHNHDAVYAALAHAHSGADITSGTVAIGRLPTGTSGTTVALGNDSRFTDARTPTAHVHSGADITSGTVPIAQLPTGTSGTTVALGNHNHDAVYAALSHNHAGEAITSGTVATARLSVGTTAGTVAAGDDSRFDAAVAIPPGPSPASILNIGTRSGQTHFGLQVARDGDASSTTKSQADLAAGYEESPYFVTNAAKTAVSMRASVNGPLVGSSSYARCELREAGLTGTDFLFDALDSGTHRLHGRTSITHLMAVKPEVVVAQLHNGTTDRVAIRTQLVSGTIRLRIRINGSTATLDAGGTDLYNPYVPGTEFEWMIEMVNGTLKVYVNDMVTAKVTSTALTTTGSASWYFKAGVYLQSQNGVDGDSPTDYGSVELRDLWNWHTGWPTVAPFYAVPKHAATHATAGYDPIAPADIGAAAASHAHSGADITSGTVAIGRLPTGTSGTTVALGNHVHAAADVTSGTFDIARIPTGTSGTTVAFGNHTHAAGDVTSGTFAIGRIPTGTSSSTVAIGNDTRLSVKPYPPVTLTDAATVAVDASLGTHFRWTGTTTRIMGNPTNPVDGQVITFELKASSGTPNHTWSSAYAFGSDVTGTTALVAGKTDYVQFVYASSVSKWQCIGYVKGYTT